MQAQANIALVAVDGDLDVTRVPALRRRIDALVSSGCRRIVLNLVGARYVDSSGMGLIVTELRRMREQGGLLSLVNVSQQTYRALCRMRLVDRLPVSCLGARRRVSALDPSVLPSWRTTFRVDPSGLSKARERLGDMVAQLPLSSDETFDLELAVGEALGNAVDHTCGEGVLATVAAYPDRVVVDVTDCGCGFSLGPDDEPPQTGPCAERGRGIRLMRLLADAVSIFPKPTGTGTVVRLVKLFDSAREVMPQAAGA